MGTPVSRDEELLQTITNRIAEAINPQKIILFGSWARGEGGPHSDVDLLIIQESTLPRPQRYAQVRRLFWGMGIPMDILVYARRSSPDISRSPAVSPTRSLARGGWSMYDPAREQA